METIQFRHRRAGERSQAQTRRRPWRRLHPGSALVAVIFVLLLMTLLGGTLMTMTTNNLHIGDIQRRNAIAFNLAESGSSRAALWLRQQGSPPSGTTAFDPWTNPVTFGEGSYSVTITPDPANASNYLKGYFMTATGTANGQTQKVNVWMRQASFGRYAYFTDSEVSSITGNPIWFKKGEVIDGPAHSNNSTETYNDGAGLVTQPTYFHINWNGSTAPIFLDQLTSVANQIEYNPSMPTTETDWKKIFRDGSSGFKLGVNPIDLPTSSDVQKNAAWGATSGFPSSNGVYVPNNGTATNGGIYIKGDASVALTVASGNQVFTITQGSTTTTVTLNKSTNQTDVQVGAAAPTHYDGLTNGVIYSENNITSLSGTVADNQVSGSSIVKRNAFTIAADVNAGRKITITNHLQYNTPPDKTQAYNSTANLAAGTLGLLAKDVMIGSAAPSDLKLHAVVLAGGKNTSDGSFWVENYSTGGSPTGKGNLNLIGGIIQKKRGPVGTFNPTTGATVSGYAKNYSYDPRMADNPPPFFPTTGAYDQLSWRRIP
jgi:Tfp pilus assembly protein PilX